MHSLAGCLKVSPTWFIPKMTATANATADDSNNTIYIANILLSSRMENVQTRHWVLETFILVSRNLVSLFSKTPSSEQRTRTLNTAYITTAKSWSSQQQTKYYENTSSIVTKSLLLDWWHTYIVQLTTMESTSLTFKAFDISKVVWEILWRHTWKIKKITTGSMSLLGCRKAACCCHYYSCWWRTGSCKWQHTEYGWCHTANKNV